MTLLDVDSRPLIVEREILRIGMEAFGKFRCHEAVTERRIILNLPCPFHPSLMELLLPCLETSYLAMRSVCGELSS